MNAPTRFKFVSILGITIAGASACVLIAVLILWVSTYQQALAFTIPGPGETEFSFTSLEGRFMFGVFEHDQRGPRWWRPPHAGMPDLILGDRLAVADLWGWGIAIPHPLLALFACIPIAWWLIVFKDRREDFRRTQLGLCLNCGYDISHSSGRCPECGTPCGIATGISAMAQ